MQLELDALGMIPATYPKKFYRVEDYKSGKRIADFTTESEARKVAYASYTGLKFDHKICHMTLVN